ncbi:MAG: VacJ family lipoprotein [Gammaproteobacteria bacterium]|nr:VacJ family lipoprotein [Gammaproteobacteria bacterium]
MRAIPRSLSDVGALLGTALLALLVTGCATAPEHVDPRDPWEGFNRSVHAFNTDFDRGIGKPLAETYKLVTPEPVDTAVTNFFGNIGDLLVLINNLLQGKPGDAASDGGRVLMNTTFGILGFIDVASSVGLEAHNEDFGQTFGVWGIEPGPYVVLPFLGPHTVRDAVGWYVGFEVDDYWEFKDRDTRRALLALELVDMRADLMRTTNIVETAALDQYAFIRDAYLQRRQFLIYDGDPPEQNDYDYDYEDVTPAAAPMSP